MVRVEIGGKPIIDIDYKPGDKATFKETVRTRTRTRGNISKDVNFHWNNVLPRLVLTSDTDDFDHTTIDHFKAEGFQITYLPYSGNHKEYTGKLGHLADPLDLGERYAIVAYGDAASLCLEACQKPMPKLCALVAYYPPYMPKATTEFPPSLLVQVHLASSQKFGTRHLSFRYPDTQPGFAEHDLEEYDNVGANIAWSRTLGILRKGFGIDADLERIWDDHCNLEFVEKDADATMKTMVAEPYVNHVPVMTGGIGAADLRRFYADYFIPGNPKSLRMRLLSRTVGTDRVVDEMLCTFSHDSEIAWMLPGIPPTGKLVVVVVVAVVCIRGGKLYHEHIHWDQASVLVQIGLLDPNLVPETFTTMEKGKESEVKRLPVLGAEAARKVVDERDGKSNELIPSW